MKIKVSIFLIAVSLLVAVNAYTSEEKGWYPFLNNRGWYPDTGQSGSNFNAEPSATPTSANLISGQNSQAQPTPAPSSLVPLIYSS
jgi:hypothetical protein